MNEKITYTINGTVTNESNWVIAEGHIRLSGVGGLCVNNVLNIDVKVNLFRNSSAPDMSIINNPTSIDFHPQFSFNPCDSVNVENPPKPFHLYLNESNNWHASGAVEFFDSGSKAINMTFINANMKATDDMPNQVLLVSSNVITISDEAVYVSKVNNDYIVFLSILIVALTWLQFRPKEDINNEILISALSFLSLRAKKEAENKTDNNKADLDTSKETDEKKNYPKGRSKYNYRIEKKSK